MRRFRVFTRFGDAFVADVDAFTEFEAEMHAMRMFGGELYAVTIH